MRENNIFILVNLIRTRNIRSNQWLLDLIHKSICAIILLIHIVYKNMILCLQKWNPSNFMCLLEQHFITFIFKVQLMSSLKCANVKRKEYINSVIKQRMEWIIFVLWANYNHCCDVLFRLNILTTSFHDQNWGTFI